MPVIKRAADLDELRKRVAEKIEQARDDLEQMQTNEVTMRHRGRLAALRWVLSQIDGSPDTPEAVSERSLY